MMPDHLELVLFIHSGSLILEKSSSNFHGKSFFQIQRKQAISPRICVKYFLSHPQKTCHQRKLRQHKCLLLKFSLIEFMVTPEKSFGAWKFDKSGVLVNSINQELNY